MNVKLGRPIDFAAEVQRLSRTGHITLLPLLARDMLDFDSDQAVPEMHDRMIAGVARRMNAVLSTRDPLIVASNVVATVW
jgi:hypothetical protein